MSSTATTASPAAVRWLGQPESTTAGQALESARDERSGNAISETALSTRQ